MKKVDITRKEPLLNTTNPVGSNRLSSRASFFQRKLYEMRAFTDPSLTKNKPIDLLYKQMFYGRIDEQNNVVQLKQEKLKQIPQPRDTILVIDFVADAFADFKEAWTNFANKGILESKSTLFNLIVKKGWSDVNLFYYNLMTVYYDKFRVYVLENKKDSSIRDLKSFLVIFTEFLDLQTPFLPFTRSIANLSRFNNPNTSGIVLELKIEKHGDDKRKMENYINDPNFPLFKSTAMRFGFIIDKHAPWRLFADLDSPAMKPYMDKYEVNLEKFFELYYEKSLYGDVEILKPYITQMYNAFISSKPSIAEHKFIICNGRTKLTSKTTKRKTVTKESVEIQIPDELWLRFYLYIRAREQNLDWNQEVFEQNVNNCLQFKTGVDTSRALDYAENKTRLAEISSRKHRHFHFLRD